MKVKSILISQPEPADLEKSPYTRLVEKYNLEIDYHKFIDHYFRIAKELRFMVPESMKYFCISESTAFYLQKYVQFRKRKIFHGNQSFDDLMDIMKKYKADKFLYPCSEIHKPDIPEKLKKNRFHFRTSVLYRTLAADLSDLDMNKYEMIVFFSPSGIKSLFSNFPEFKQEGRHIATFGSTTSNAAKEFGLKVTIEAPTAKAPSMSMAIDDFIKEQRKRKR